MAELTLESLAKRVEAIEKELAERRELRSIPPARDWRSVIGLSEDNEFTRAMRAEMQARRDADRGDEAEGDDP